MERKPAVVLRAEEIAQKQKAFSQRLNPRSYFLGTGLARRGGLKRVGVGLATLPPGKESFAYHAHRYEEEWMYVIRGRGVAEIDGKKIEIGPGDFVAFPAPQVAHLVANPFQEDLVYLMGGENNELDVIDYPQLGKTYLLAPGDRQVDFFELGEAQHPFGPADEK